VLGKAGQIGRYVMNGTIPASKRRRVELDGGDLRPSTVDSIIQSIAVAETLKEHGPRPNVEWRARSTACRGGYRRSKPEQSDAE